MASKRHPSAARRAQAAKATRKRLSARAALASVRARAAARSAPPAGGVDESDSKDSLILDLAGGDDGDTGHPARATASGRGATASGDKLLLLHHLLSQ